MSGAQELRARFEDHSKWGVPAAVLRMAARNREAMAVRLKYQDEDIWVVVWGFRLARGSKPQELYVCVAQSVVDSQHYRVAYDLPEQTAYVIDTITIDE